MTLRLPGRLLSPLAALTGAAASAAAAETITPIADAARGARVTVEGTVARVLDEDEIRLADPSGEIVVYLGPEPPVIAAGERLTVRGVVDDDGPREIYAQEIVRADGVAIALRQDE